MRITVTREAVGLADDQLEPLELTLEFGADATLEDLTGKLARGRFLHFSSTCRVLVGRSANEPLLKLESRRGTLSAEYLVAADTRLADAVPNAALDFRFERVPVLRPAQSDLECRRPVWLALSDLFLDTDVNLLRAGNVCTLAASPYTLDELDAILREEVYPACSFNLSLVAGEWAGFDADWLERRILCGGPPPRSWWRRLGRYLRLGWTIPVRLPEEWPLWREDVAQLRRQVPATSSPSPQTEPFFGVTVSRHRKAATFCWTGFSPKRAYTLGRAIVGQMLEKIMRARSSADKKVSG